MGAVFLGPRLGRFNDDGTVNRFEHSNPTSMVLGVFILCELAARALGLALGQAPLGY